MYLSKMIVRGYCDKQKKMFEPEDLNEGDFTPCLNNGELAIGHYIENGNWNELNLMRYTGITDKKWKKIFENDFVEFINSNTGEKYIGEVRYEEKWAGFYFSGNIRLNSSMKNIKVIGDRYRNFNFFEKYNIEP